MGNNPRIYIGTLYSGENELEDSIASIKKQNYKNWTHEIFEYLKNKEAHDKLYNRFMELKDDYDLFIKLDADMVFDTDEALDIIIKYFKENPNLDHLVLMIKDWYTNSQINGLSVFSNRVNWVQNSEKLFVDTIPERSGLLIIANPDKNVVLHSPNPSEFQAFHFGVHRTIKALQRNNFINFKWIFARGQRKTLLKVAKKYYESNDERLLFSLAGCKYIFENKFNDAHYDYTNDYLLKFFEANKEKILLEKNEIINFMKNDFNKLFVKKTVLKFLISAPFEIPRFLMRKLDKTLKIVK